MLKKLKENKKIFIIFLLLIIYCLYFVFVLPSATLWYNENKEKIDSVFTSSILIGGLINLIIFIRPVVICFKNIN